MASGFAQQIPGNAIPQLDAWAKTGEMSEEPQSLEEWIRDQRTRSFGYLLDNIGPNGTNARDAAPGVVIASPSRDSPNYYYQWIRDAAITMADVVEEYERTQDEKLKPIIESYADMQGSLQNTFNPSGGYTTGGLGEPKFMVDGAPFTSHWGRPQRDGPPLRVLTLIRYIELLNMTNPGLLKDDWLQKMYDGKLPTRSIIKADLQYIAETWKEKGYDLWEEVDGMHFFTALCQHKALIKGRDLALSLNDVQAAAWYQSQQTQLRGFLENKFWDEEKGHLVAILNHPQRGGLDTALLLGALHAGQDDLFAPWSDKILASLDKLVESMVPRHPINKPIPLIENDRLRGVGIGRYPEDVYDGVEFSDGNPWFLCTSTVSSILYITISRFHEMGEFEITPTTLAFFNKLHPEDKAEIGHYSNTTPEFTQYLKSMFTYADGFLEVIRRYATEEGRLSEQFDGNTGLQCGAHDLTWSYGSFITAANKRREAKKALFGID